MKEYGGDGEKPSDTPKDEEKKGETAAGGGKEYGGDEGAAPEGGGTLSRFTFIFIRS